MKGSLSWSPKPPAFPQEAEEDDKNIEGKEGLARNWRPVSFSFCLTEDLHSSPFYLKSADLTDTLSSVLPPAFVDNSPF